MTKQQGKIRSLGLMGNHRQCIAGEPPWDYCVVFVGYLAHPTVRDGRLRRCAACCAGSLALACLIPIRRTLLPPSDTAAGFSLDPSVRMACHGCADLRRLPLICARPRSYSDVATGSARSGSSTAYPDPSARESQRCAFPYWSLWIISRPESCYRGSRAIASTPFRQAAKPCAAPRNGEFFILGQSSPSRREPRAAAMRPDLPLNLDLSSGGSFHGRQRRWLGVGPARRGLRGRLLGGAASF